MYPSNRLMNLDAFVVQLYTNQDLGFARTFSYESVYRYYFSRIRYVSTYALSLTHTIRRMRQDYYVSRVLQFFVLFPTEQERLDALRKEIEDREALLQDALLYPIRTKVLTVVWAETQIDSILDFYKAVAGIFHCRDRPALPTDVEYCVYQFIPFPDVSSV